MTGAVSQCPVKGTDWTKVWMQSYNSRSDYFYTLVSGSYYNPASYKPMLISGAANTLILCDTADDTGRFSTTWANSHKYGNGSVQSQSQLFLDGHQVLALTPRTAKRVGLGF